MNQSDYDNYGDPVDESRPSGRALAPGGPRVNAEGEADAKEVPLTKPPTQEEAYQKLKAAADALEAKAAEAKQAEAEPGAMSALPLTETAFGYGLLYFKLQRVKGIEVFVPSSLYNDHVRAVLSAAGFAKRRVGRHFVLIRKQGRILSEVSAEMMKDFVSHRVEAMREGYRFTFARKAYDIPVEGVREIFFRNSNNIFNERWLQQMPENSDPVLKDTRTRMFFPFRNGLVTMTKDGATLAPWNEGEGPCVWDSQLIRRDYDPEDTSHSSFPTCRTDASSVSGR